MAASSATTHSAVHPSDPANRLCSTGFAAAVVIATLALWRPWITLITDCFGDALHSYAILIPVISGWLIRQKSSPSPAKDGRQVILGLTLLSLAVVTAIAGARARQQGQITGTDSWLTTQIGAWVLAVWGSAATFHHTSWLRRHIFALSFLAFTIPLPAPAVDAVEIALQDASATASDWLFSLTSTPYLREGRLFWFPNVHIEVAQECSGIRSTLVLFITGVLGSHLLLKRFRHRSLLIAAIIPLGILRNAIRIITLTLLSVHVNPEIMHSALHRRGGPLFFAVSLVPLFLLFWWLSRREKSAASASKGVATR